MSRLKRIIAIMTTVIFWGVLGLLVLLYINPAGLVLMLSGFQSDGDTTDYFKTIETERGLECYLPWPVSQTAGIQYPPQAVGAIQVVHWSMPDGYSGFSADQLRVEQLERGVTTTGQMMLYAEYSEQGLNEVWEQTLSSFAQPQPELAKRVENERVELKSDAVIIHADVNMGTKWQEVGIILALDKQNLQFVVEGIDVAGEYYAPPTKGTIADLIARLEMNINEVLDSAQLVDSHSTFNVQHIAIHEDRVQILAGWENVPRLSPICPTDWSLRSPSGQVQTQLARRVNNIHIQHWALPEGGLAFNAKTLGTRRLEQGQTTQGQPVYYAKIDEAALNDLWQNELYQYANPGPEMMTRIRNPRVALRTGVVTIYADMKAGTQWQQVGILLALDEKTPQFRIAGVDFDGRWHPRPEDGPLSELVNQVEENINEVLRSARLIDPSGAEIPLHSLAIEDGWLLLLARD